MPYHNSWKERIGNNWQLGPNLDPNCFHLPKIAREMLSAGFNSVVNPLFDALDAAFGYQHPPAAKPYYNITPSSDDIAKAIQGAIGYTPQTQGGSWAQSLGQLLPAVLLGNKALLARNKAMYGPLADMLSQYAAESPADHALMLGAATTLPAAWAASNPKATGSPDWWAPLPDWTKAILGYRGGGSTPAY